MSVDYTIPKDEIRAGQFEIDGDVFVRVVCCRDCLRVSYDGVLSTGWCNENCREVRPFDFCAWGERKVEG